MAQEKDLNRCKTCNCPCHCSKEEHSDMYGPCSCSECICDFPTNSGEECLSCQ